nr:RidA family protein [Acetobacter garciniae]
MVLPPVGTPRGNYVPVRQAGEWLFVSGQGPRWGNDLRYKGKLGQDLDIQAGQDAARLCALNILAHVRAFLDGDLGPVRQLVRIAGVVQCVDGFEQQATVLNGASDLFVMALGEAGRHVRIAIGTSSLPSGMAVEVEAMFQLR